MDHKCQLRKRKKYSSGRSHKNLSTFSCNWFVLSIITWTSIWRSNAMVEPNFMAWWVRWHPVNDSHMEFQSKLMAKGQVFSLFQGLQISIKLFLLRGIVIYREQYIFAQKLWKSVLWFTNRALPKIPGFISNF